MYLSENQQDWFYTIIGLLISLLGISWIIIFIDSPIYLLGILAGPISGFFLFKGKLKRYKSVWIRPNKQET